MATDYILVIDGLKGESQDGQYKEGIDLLSWGIGVSNPGSSASQGGGGRGAANFSDLSCNSAASKASPELMKLCATGKPITKAVLHVRKQGGKQEEYLTITLENAIISSFNTGDAPGGDVAVVDSFSLNYAKIKYEYKPQKDDGSLDSAVTTGYDLKLKQAL